MIMLGLQQALDLDESEAMELSSAECMSQSSGLMGCTYREERDNDDDEDDYLMRI